MTILFTIKFLHFLYTIANLYILFSLLPSTISLTSTFSFKSLSFHDFISVSTMRVLATMIAFFLVLDNSRYSILGQSEILHHSFSRLCFFSHEAIMPFSLLFIPIIPRLVSDHSLIGSKPTELITQGSITQNYINITIILITFIFVVLGLHRYMHMTNWYMEESSYGVLVCRPSHSSMAALIPIFINIIGLILVSLMIIFTNSFSSISIEMKNKVYFLLVSQLIVLIGNGLIGPRKLLMTLFGNGFEIIWLYSIVQLL